MKKEKKDENVPLDDFFPMPSLSTTLSAHCTRGPRPRAGCSPRSLRIGPCVCTSSSSPSICVSVRVPALGSSDREAVTGPAPLPEGRCGLWTILCGFVESACPAVFLRSVDVS